MFQNFRPKILIKKFEMKREAKVDLSLDSSIAAQFYQFSYNDRICTSRQQCFSIGSWNTGTFCRNEEHCEDIPKISQALKDLRSTSNSRLEIEAEENLPDWKIDEIVDRLASRFMLSNYTEKTRKQTEDVTTITLGVMKKNASEVYHDEIHTERVNETRIEQISSVLVNKLFIDNALTNVFGQSVPATTKHF